MQPIAPALCSVKAPACGRKIRHISCSCSVPHSMLLSHWISLSPSNPSLAGPHGWLCWKHPPARAVVHRLTAAPGRVCRRSVNLSGGFCVNCPPGHGAVKLSLGRRRLTRGTLVPQGSRAAVSIYRHPPSAAVDSTTSLSPCISLLSVRTLRRGRSVCVAKGTSRALPRCVVTIRQPPHQCHSQFFL